LGFDFRNSCIVTQRGEGRTARRPRVRPSFITAGAAVTGRGHEATGNRCQDAVARKSRRGNHVVVLSDGAGSALHAESGAQALAAAVANHLSQHLPHVASLTQEHAKTAIVDVARTALLRLAQKNCWNFPDLAATLLFAGTDGTTFLAGQLGDGRIGVRAHDKASWHPLDTASRGEFSNETYFITSGNPVVHLKLARCPMSEVGACVLMSDGAEAGLFQRRTGIFAAAVETMGEWARMASAERCQRSITSGLSELLRMQTMDDVSVAYLVKR
jgi:hypothetical protein